MRASTFVAASVAFVAGANATWDNVTYTTEVVTAYTTVCPTPTVIVHGSKTYTVTESTTLTITNCPCTVTKPVYTAPVLYCSTCHSSYTPVVSVSTTPVATSKPVVHTSVTPASSTPASSTPVVISTPIVSTYTSIISIGEKKTSTVLVPTTRLPIPPAPVTTPVYRNATSNAPVGTATGAPGSSTSPRPFLGAANKAFAASGASLAGLLGLAAVLL